MSSPFEDEDAGFVVLFNVEGQYSLWPTFAEVPNGWKCVKGPASRNHCLEYIEEHWDDMRPRSVIEAISKPASAK